MQHTVTHEYAPAGDDEPSHIRVFIRGRPPAIKEDNVDFLSVQGEEGDVLKKVVIKDPKNKAGSEVGFVFDRIFWTEEAQDTVFDHTCRKQIDHVLQGFNSCCFAYGQTGSGKTHSMFGPQGGTIGGDDRGMIPRAVEYLFNKLGERTGQFETAMVCSFLEIYNDSIRDLGKAYLVAMGTEVKTEALTAKTSDLFERIVASRMNPYFAPAFHKKAPGEEEACRPGLKEVQEEYRTMNYDIREDNEGNVFVKDLSLVPVTTTDEVKSMIQLGLKVYPTNSNHPLLEPTILLLFCLGSC
jgi:hypothetical protein